MTAWGYFSRGRNKHRLRPYARAGSSAGVLDCGVVCWFKFRRIDRLWLCLLLQLIVYHHSDPDMRSRNSANEYSIAIRATVIFQLWSAECVKLANYTGGFFRLSSAAWRSSSREPRRETENSRQKVHSATFQNGFWLLASLETEDSENSSSPLTIYSNGPLKKSGISPFDLPHNFGLSEMINNTL